MFEMILKETSIKLLLNEVKRQQTWAFPRHASSWNQPELLSAISALTTDSRKGKRRQKPAVAANRAPPSRTVDDKELLLQAALANIASKFGKDTVMRLGQEPSRRNIPVISTGSLALDIALGVGGLPKGRVVEIYGPEATGKTTLALHVIAEAQKFGGKCVFLDVEHALDTSFAEALGVRLADLYVSQPDSAEQALEITDEVIRSGGADVVVVDSVAALAPKAELEGNMGDAHMALQARLMSQALRKLTHSLGRSQTILIFINQIRSKLGSFGGFGGAPIEVTAGGNALKFYASVRLKIKKLSLHKRGDETTGTQVLVTVAKNKVAPPFKTAEFEIEFGKGISQQGEILDIAVKLGLLGKSGSWFSHEGENFANGRENAKIYLKENEEFANGLVEAIKEKLQLRPETAGDDFEDEDELDEGYHDLGEDGQVGLVSKI